MEKINESESWFFEKISKIEKPFVRGIKKKRKRAQVHKIGNEKKKKNKREMTTDTTEIQRIIRDY